VIKVLIKPTKYINWEEFKDLDSEAQFWSSVNSDPDNALTNMGLIA
jgi:hypothetical protein